MLRQPPNPCIISKPLPRRRITAEFGVLVHTLAFSESPMRKLPKLLLHYLLRCRDTRFYTPSAANPVPAASAFLSDLDLLDAGELAPTPRVYHAVITACAQSKNLEDARRVHAHLASSRFAGDAFLDNSLIHAYCKCGSVLDAQKVFDGVRRKDMVSWTSLIAGYAQNDMAAEAIGLLPGMLEGRLKPNGFTFASLLKAAGAYADSGIGAQIHAVAVKCDWHEDVYVGSALLDMYARCRKMVMATAVFDRLDLRNGVSWNALISGFSRKGD